MPRECPDVATGRLGGGDGRRGAGTRAGGVTPAAPAALPTIRSGGPPGVHHHLSGFGQPRDRAVAPAPPGPPHGSGAMSEARRLAVASPRPGRLFRRPPRLGQSPDSRGAKTCAGPTKPMSRREPWSAMNHMIHPRACPPLARRRSGACRPDEITSTGVMLGRAAHRGEAATGSSVRVRRMDAAPPRASIYTGAARAETEPRLGGRGREPVAGPSHTAPGRTRILRRALRAGRVTRRRGLSVPPLAAGLRAGTPTRSDAPAVGRTAFEHLISGSRAAWRSAVPRLLLVEPPRVKGDPSFGRWEATIATGGLGGLGREAARLRGPGRRPARRTPGTGPMSRPASSSAAGRGIARRGGLTAISGNRPNRGCDTGRTLLRRRAPPRGL